MKQYAVIVAKDGKEAVEIYRSDGDRIRLVILDMIMPDTGGQYFRVSPVIGQQRGYFCHVGWFSAARNMFCHPKHPRH